MTAKKQMEDYFFNLVTPYGEIEVSYQLADDEDNEILLEVLECLETNSVWFCNDGDHLSAVFNGKHLDYIDFKKVIGIRF